MADALSKPDPWLWRTRPRAPQPGAVLGPIDDILMGQAKEYIFGRGTTVFSMMVVRQDGNRVYGYLNLCPHYSQPLNYRNGAFMNDEGTRIRCTMHFAEFRVKDGYGVSGAAEKCWLDPVPVLVKSGVVYISTLEEYSTHD
ncbi:MAG: Rieske 2Fe-2S domain-containing protein [Gammaproteobacteria bacterium]|nr:Rieske 2Fe-2S domain-containing protein [Gammaproteobacteria bacterium]